jgi:hypothetical protein
MLILLAALGAAAQPATAAPPPKADDPIICKRDASSEVGTHMRPKPVCMKKSEWQLVEQNAQRELSNLKERSAKDPGMAGTPR